MALPGLHAQAQDLGWPRIGRAGRRLVSTVVGVIVGVVGGHAIVDRARPRHLHEAPLGVITVVDGFGCYCEGWDKGNSCRNQRKF